MHPASSRLDSRRPAVVAVAAAGVAAGAEYGM